MSYDLSAVMAQIIVVNDRVLSGERLDHTGPMAQRRLKEAGLARVGLSVIGEMMEQIDQSLSSVLAGPARLVLILGGTGISHHDQVPEVVREVIEIELPGIAERIRSHGLLSTPLSSLSRGVVGVTSRDRHGVLIVASPGSKGGAGDTLDVLVPLLEHIFSQLDEN